MNCARLSPRLRIRFESLRRCRSHAASTLIPTPSLRRRWRLTPTVGPTAVVGRTLRVRALRGLTGEYEW